MFEIQKKKSLLFLHGSFLLFVMILHREQSRFSSAHTHIHIQRTIGFSFWNRWKTSLKSSKTTDYLHKILLVSSNAGIWYWVNENGCHWISIHSYFGMSACKCTVCVYISDICLNTDDAKLLINCPVEGWLNIFFLPTLFFLYAENDDDGFFHFIQINYYETLCACKKRDFFIVKCLLHPRLTDFFTAMCIKKQSKSINSPDKFR